MSNDDTGVSPGKKRKENKNVRGIALTIILMVITMMLITNRIHTHSEADTEATDYYTIKAGEYKEKLQDILSLDTIIGLNSFRSKNLSDTSLTNNISLNLQQSSHTASELKESNHLRHTSQQNNAISGISNNDNNTIHNNKNQLHRNIFHPGTDISVGNELNLLNCANQSVCIQPEIQLTKRLNIYLCSHPVTYGFRFYYIVHEGLLLHPNINLLPFSEVDKADFIIYLPNSAPWHKTECTSKRFISKLIVLDEYDPPSLFRPNSSIEAMKIEYGVNMTWYSMYFKRSFVIRKNGQFKGYPHLKLYNLYPLVYSISDKYIPYKFTFKRDISILCTLRGSNAMPTRQRVSDWVKEYAHNNSLHNAIVSEVNSASRTAFSRGYFEKLYSSEIIVTVNPAHWEGDFRLWESMASGALVFVDPLHVPYPYPLKDGVHAIFYDNNNKTDLLQKLDYYLKHKDKARQIAINGYLHSMKYHRTVSMMDYILRSAHLHQSLLSNEDMPKYQFTAQFLLHKITGKHHV